MLVILFFVGGAVAPRGSCGPMSRREAGLGGLRRGQQKKTVIVHGYETHIFLKIQKIVHMRRKLLTLNAVRGENGDVRM